MDLRAANKAAAEEWIPQLQTVLSKLNSPEMSNWLDQQLGPDQYVKIDKIEIDLGELQRGLSKDAIRTQILSSLKEQISQKLQPSANDQASLPVLDRPTWLRQELENYLLTGYWNQERLSMSPVQVWRQLKAEDQAVLQQMIGKLSQIKPTYVLSRLVWQWPMQDILFLLPDNWVKELQLGAKEEWLQIIDRGRFHRLVISAFKLHYVDKKEAMIVDSYQILREWWSKQVQEADPSNPAVLWLRRKKLGELLPQMNQKQAFEELLSLDTTINLISSITKEEASQDETSKTATSKTDIRQTSSHSSLRITNAGLVLCHPFIPILFKSFGFLTPDKKRFGSLEKQFRAIGLLHYLAVGDEPLIEGESIMYKLFCGLDLDAPIPLEIPLTEEEKNEADKLLTSIIGHWSALGKTSIAGLQEGFLRRPGHLLRDEISPVLHVEKKTIDILLNKLPWGISVIRFPWLQEFIRVEWSS